LALALSLAFFRGDARRFSWAVFIYLFVSTLSHPLLDMFTNGGLGVALLAPFSGERYFAPWRPIQVSPISVSSFFSSWGLRVLGSELKWVWLPASVVFAVGQLARRLMR